MSKFASTRRTAVVIEFFVILGLSARRVMLLITVSVRAFASSIAVFRCFNALYKLRNNLSREKSSESSPATTNIVPSRIIDSFVVTIA